MRGALLMAAAGGALLLAGCGSSGTHQASGQAMRTPVTSASGGGAGAGTGTSASPSANSSATGSKAAASPSGTAAMCLASALTLTLNDSQGGGAAGSTYLPLDFTNSSRSSCELYGFPGVSFVTSAGAQIGAPASRATEYGKVRITLAPGKSAHVWLQVADAQNYPDSTCQPATASALRVYPPENTAARYVQHSFAACRSMSAPILTVTPLRAGRGTQGAIP
jgi:Protein of unknown function (DUF4232)